MSATPYLTPPLSLTLTAYYDALCRHLGIESTHLKFGMEEPGTQEVASGVLISTGVHRIGKIAQTGTHESLFSPSACRNEKERTEIDDDDDDNDLWMA